MNTQRGPSPRELAGILLPALGYYLAFFAVRYVLTLLHVPAGSLSHAASALLLPFLAGMYWHKKIPRPRVVIPLGLGIFAAFFFVLLRHPLYLRYFSLCLAGPVAEEIVFRGWVYARSKKAFGLWPAVLLSALLFAVGHGSPLQMALAFPAGCLLALLREKTGALFFPILAHILWNLLV